MEHIKTLFDRLYHEPFPSERGKEVLGVDLVLIDADTMGLVSQFISKKVHLEVDKIKMLERCYADLKSIVPQFDKNEKQYFASLKQLANDTLDIAKSRKLSDTEIEHRHKWKSVYKQIKDIVNELDPLGVADMVEDEYDDLNFKIYSLLLGNRQDSKVFSAIKTFIGNYYGVQVDDEDLNKTIIKLNSISLDN